MKNQDKWQPGKYVFRKGKLIASRNPKEVGVGSRLAADMAASAIEAALREHARGKLVDLGCGKAPLYLVYKDYTQKITCVDWGQSKHETQYIDIECDLNQDLEQIRLKAIGGVPEIMTDIFAKNILRVPVLGQSLSKFAQWFALWFVGTKFGRNVSRKTGRDFPLGYCLVAKKP